MGIRDTTSLVERLRAMNARKIMLMLPDGLKRSSYDLFNELSRKFAVILASDAFYGACDIGNPDIYRDVDVIVQFGHSVIPNINYPRPVIFEEYRTEFTYDLPDQVYDPIVGKGYRTVGLLASIQYLDTINDVKDHLERLGLAAKIGRQDSRMGYPGQVLGCNFSAAHSISADVDCFLVISTGRFHAIGAQLSGSKESFILDLNERKVSSMKDETEKFLRKRYAKISQSLKANRFCVIVDTKVGQYRKKLADLICTQLKELGKDYIMMYSNEFNSNDIVNSGSDAVIFTGCPRVPIDDYDRFPFPILTPVEFQTLFGFKKSDRYVLDEIVEVDRLN